MKRRVTRLTSAAVAPLILAGCATPYETKMPDGHVLFFVAGYRGDFARVESKHKHDIIEIIVLPSENQNSRVAIRHLRNRDWKKALDCFEQAKKDDMNDHRSIFGMGVCMEKLGDDVYQIQILLSGFGPENRSRQLDRSLVHYQSALEHYKAAVLLHIDSKFEASRDRVDMKIKALTQDKPDQSVAPPH